MLVVADADVKDRDEVSPLEEVRDTEPGDYHDLVHTAAGGAAKGRNDEEEYRDKEEFLGKQQNGAVDEPVHHDAVAADDVVKDREKGPPSSFVDELRDDMELNIDDHEAVDKRGAAVDESALVTDAAAVAEGMEEESLLSSFEKKEFRDDTESALASVVVVVVFAGEELYPLSAASC